jgi:hypothetical protein
MKIQNAEIPGNKGQTDYLPTDARMEDFRRNSGAGIPPRF